jgi:prevent-host-death family protein
MDTINIHEAKTHLSRIVEEVAAGAEVFIAKAGKPMVKMSPITAGKPAIRFGVLKGKIRVPEDFDAPLPADVLASFAGDH